MYHRYGKENNYNHFNDDNSEFSKSCPPSIWLMPLENDEDIDGDFEEFLSKSECCGKLDEVDSRLKRRRQIHNAVERKRRDHINEMIQKLNQLISEYPPESEPTKSNKGEILSKTVEYIMKMQSDLNEAINFIRTHHPDWKRE